MELFISRIVENIFENSYPKNAQTKNSFKLNWSLRVSLKIVCMVPVPVPGYYRPGAAFRK